MTGSARPQRRFDVSYAINTLTQADIAKIAPINFSTLIGTLPGFQAEPTGGEVQNIYRIRGLPGDAGFTNFQEDGLPFFMENDGSFFRGDSLIKTDLMMERLEVVRGGPAPIYASYAGAIINQITVTGSDVARGKAQVTLGDTGLYRLDAFQAGPLGGDTYYAIGGFIRQHDGYRDNGFPNDRGGQIRGNIRHDFSNGSVRFNFTYVNDSNVFYLPVPIADPRDPNVSLNKYLNYFTGTMNSPAFENVDISFRNGNGAVETQNSSLSTGRHMKMLNGGLSYDVDLDGWQVSAKAGYTSGDMEFNAFYSTTNPVDGKAFADSFLTASQKAFGPGVTRLGYVLAGTTTVYDPYQASGLVMQGQYRHVTTRFYSGQGDLSVTRKFETGIGSHDLRVGLFASTWGQDMGQAYQDYLIEVAGKPRTLDLLAYSADGKVLGGVTKNGVYHQAVTLSKGSADATMFALYANDTWEITRGLRLDAGIRHDVYSYRGWGALVQNYNMGDPTTLSDDAVRGFTGQIVNRKYKEQSTNWTAGLNYDFTKNFGAYVRASHLEQVPGSQMVTSTSTPTNTTVKADQYEAGLKLNMGRSYFYVTGFLTNYDPYNASFTPWIDGRVSDTPVPFIGKARVIGVEMDGKYSPTPWFSLNGVLTISNPQYKDFQNTDGADPRAVEGKQFVREPKVYGNIRPNFNFTAGETDISIYGIYNYMGKRYVDLYNNTALPAYGTFGAGATATLGTWQLQVVGDNLFNGHGLTEGNTRTDGLAGQGSVNAIYGRPIFGRNFRLVLSKSW